MPKGRRVRRVVRKFDTWTVLKVSLLFNLCMFVVFLTAGIILYKGAETAGGVALVEKALRSNLQLESFTINGRSLFQGALVMGAVIAALVTFLTCVTALLYNLISDLIGGIQVWVLEEVLPEPVGTNAPYADGYADDDYDDEYADDDYDDRYEDNDTYVVEDGFGPDTDEHGFLGRRRRRRAAAVGAGAGMAGAAGAGVMAGGGAATGSDSGLYDRQADPTPAPGWPASGGDGDHGHGDRGPAAGAYDGAVDPSGGNRGADGFTDHGHDPDLEHADGGVPSQVPGHDIEADNRLSHHHASAPHDSGPPAVAGGEGTPTPTGYPAHDGHHDRADAGQADGAWTAGEHRDVADAPPPLGQPFIGAHRAVDSPEGALGGHDTTTPGEVPPLPPGATGVTPDAAQDPAGPPEGQQRGGLFSRFGRRSEPAADGRSDSAAGPTPDDGVVTGDAGTDLHEDADDREQYPVRASARRWSRR